MYHKWKSCHLTRWNQIPNVGLYLEQVTKYLNEQLAILSCPPLTGSMISNYVKKGLVKNPVKKQYDREHIALLLLLGIVKCTLPLDTVQFLLSDPCLTTQQGFDWYMEVTEAAFCGMQFGTEIPSIVDTPLGDALLLTAYQQYVVQRCTKAQQEQTAPAMPGYGFAAPQKDDDSEGTL